MFLRYALKPRQEADEVYSAKFEMLQRVHPEATVCVLKITTSTGNTVLLQDICVYMQHIKTYDKCSTGEPTLELS